ncbi:kinase-like domain-containing protein [Hyaloraphidium curvatum]|nr:kinase-like domain-containing protein [Hyaloraphidium curvatum]
MCAAPPKRPFAFGPAGRRRRTEYKMLRAVGEGAQARSVRAAVHLPTAGLCVVKAYDRAPSDALPWPGLPGTAPSPDTFTREASALAGLPPHPNVVKLLDAFQTARTGYIVLEACAADLASCLARRQDRLPLPDAAQAVAALLAALAHSHANGIIHRDVKPANLLLRDPRCFSSLCLADFGSSKRTDAPSSPSPPQSPPATLAGTPIYLAPETVRHGVAGPPADVWAAGCVAHELLCGSHPFSVGEEGDSLLELYERIVASNLEVPDWLPPGARDLLSGLLHPDPALRTSAADALAHPWLSSPDLFAGDDDAGVDFFQAASGVAVCVNTDGELVVLPDARCCDQSSGSDLTSAVTEAEAAAWKGRRCGGAAVALEVACG